MDVSQKSSGDDLQGRGEASHQIQPNELSTPKYRRAQRRALYFRLADQFHSLQSCAFTGAAGYLAGMQALKPDYQSRKHRKC